MKKEQTLSSEENKSEAVDNVQLELEKIVADSLSDTTFHSIGHIYNTRDYFLKSVLLVCFLASAGFCFYLTVKTFVTFFEWDVLTSSSTVSEIPAEFPVVGFCNLNQYDFNYATNDIYNITNNGPISQFYPAFTANDYVTKVNQYFRYNLLNKYMGNLRLLYMDEFYLDQMLVSCTFQQQNCSLNDFMYHYDFNYGLCWRFNAGKNLFGNTTSIQTLGQVGWKHGLILELYAGNAQLQEKFAMERGFRFFVFNRTNVYPIAEDIGVDVATGQSTNIGIKKTVKNHLPAPYSNCLPIDITQINWNQNDVLQFMYNNFVQGQYYWNANCWNYSGNWSWDWTVSYSQSICVKMCFQKYLLQNCGCYDLTLPRSPQVTNLYIKSPCVSVSQVICTSIAQTTFYYNSNLIGDCYNKCPVECTEIAYDLTVSSSSYPTEWYAQVLNNNTNFNSVINAYFATANISFINYKNNYSELKASIARVKIYFEDLRYNEIDDSPAMDFITLLGTLGGNLGLFLGASLLSFTEFFKLFYEVIKHVVAVFWLKKNKPSGSQVSSTDIGK